MVSSKRAGQQLSSAGHTPGCHLKSITARLLVLGDKQVGKSATIVRYTTGRYIQQYNQETNDWLYRRLLPSSDAEQQQNVSKLVELMEQKDVKFSKSDNILELDADLDSSKNPALQTLARRAASDQRRASELHERHELLEKLQWANAYVIIYAINDCQSFNKAIKYLNLIANQINNTNSAQHNTRSTIQHRSGSSSSNASSCSSATTATGYTSGSSLSTSSGNSTGGAKLRSILTSAAGSLSLNNNQLHLTNNGNLVIQNQQQKRPILLLANKKDLETTGRQVSTSDGRLLAVRHQALFTEISAAESEKLVEGGMGNLIDNIDPTCLHISMINEQQLPTLSHWMPTIEHALSQSSVSLAAPVWANLIKSKPVNCSLVQSTKIPVLSPLEMNVQLVRSCVGSVQVVKSNQVSSGLIKPAMVSSLSRKHSNCSKTDSSSNIMKNPTTISSNSYHAKYETLKSSFKRASMAIVSSKVMSRSVTGNKPNTNSKSYKKNIQHKGSSASSDQDSINELQFYYEPTISEHKTSTDSSSNWIKNHIKSFNNRNSNNNNNADSNSTTGSLDYSLSSRNTPQSGSNKYKRPLFRYKNRRKTVAFEPVAVEADSLVKSISKASEPDDLADIVKEKTIKEPTRSITCDHKSVKSYSSRSSSSLSATDSHHYESPKISRNPKTQYKSSLLSLNNNSSNQTMSTLRNNSIVNLSQATDVTQSSSIANMESSLMAENDASIAVVSMVQSTPLKSSGPINISQLSCCTAIPVNNPVKKRFHLVKSVQNTISNLTGSLNVVSSQPAAKRSFCTTLFKQNPTSSITLKKVNNPNVGLAKTEIIQARSELVGYCK